MRIRVRFYARLRDMTGEREEAVESKEGETVGDILAGLSKRYGEAFEKYLYGREGQIADHIQVLLDGTSVTNLQGLKTRLVDGAQMDIIPLVAGG
jgi:molybdopterin synthase sulfur carrier subunit